MAAMTETPDNVRVGFRTSIFNLSRSSGKAAPRMSALLGRDARRALEAKAFF
jgi:hypothetical protein